VESKVLVNSNATLPRVDPSGAALGADVADIDLSQQLAPETVTALKDAWSEHQVLRFRGQRLNDRDLERFSRYFGELDLAPITTTGQPHLPETPHVAVMSNILVDGRPIGSLGNYEAAWHTDMAYNAEPPSASLLYALEVPASGGGDTWFSSMYAAYDALPAELRQRIAGLSIKHDASKNSAGELRAGFPEVTDPRLAPGATHPIVRTHPVTGRKALFVGRRLNAYVVGLELDESEALLDELFAHARHDRFTWVQHWNVGDLIMWDNRCVMHRRDSFGAEERRLLHRTQVKGDAPR
jgi:taurine dioxygenase